jgi:hypothetical protein
MRWMVIFSLLSNLLFYNYAGNTTYSTELRNVQMQYQFGGSFSISAQYDKRADLQSVELTIQTITGTSKMYPVSISDLGLLTSNGSFTGVDATPFSKVYYWFQFTFLDGSTASSPSYWFDYLDNRYTWKSNESKWFKIFWVNGDTAYGNQLQSISLAGLKSATQVLPISPTIPISIYVYPDSQSAQMLLAHSEPDWIAGSAFLRADLLVVSASTDLSSTQDLERQIPHELAHLLEYQITLENYSSSPAWLLEGLAVTAETYPNPDYARVLQKADSDSSLIAMTQLCHAFSPTSEEATLSYAQSASFVQYLISTYGNHAVMQLLQNSGDGLDCDQLVKSNLQIDLSTLDASWQAKTFSKAEKNKGELLNYWPYFLFAVILLAVIIALRWHFQKRKEKQDDHNQ